MCYILSLSQFITKSLVINPNDSVVKDKKTCGLFMVAHFDLAHQWRNAKVDFPSILQLILKCVQNSVNFDDFCDKVTKIFSVRVQQMTSLYLGKFKDCICT